MVRVFIKIFLSSGMIAGRRRMTAADWAFSGELMDLKKNNNE
jgi:hypothetical protein